MRRVTDDARGVIVVALRRGSEVLAFNGVSSGNGHLTGKRAEPAVKAS